MKHCLTRAQMRKLAEIGIDTRQLATHECTENGITYFSLSIGDLIEMLPQKISTNKGFSSGLDIYAPDEDNEIWLVGYPMSSIKSSSRELINALFDLVISLKKEGKI